MSLSCFRCCRCYFCCHCHRRNCFCYCLCKKFDCNVLVVVIVVIIVTGVVIVIVVIVFAIVCSVRNQQDNLLVTGLNVNICAVTRNVLKPFGKKGPSLFIVFVVGIVLLRVMFVDAVSIYADCRCNNVLGVYCKSNVTAYLFRFFVCAFWCLVCHCLFLLLFFIIVASLFCVLYLLSLLFERVLVIALLL